jgi:Domain of unknown function (DUF2470)
MRQDDAHPSRAERARTTLALAPTVTVTCGATCEDADTHAVSPDGSLVLVLPDRAVAARRAATGATPVAVEAARTVPVPGPDRLLDPVSLHGVATVVDTGEALEGIVAVDARRAAEIALGVAPVTLLHVAVDRVTLADEAVDADAYAHAAPDPVADRGARALEHLLRAHACWVVACAHRLPHALLRDAWELAPVQVDRFGVTFRAVSAQRRTRQARLNFPAPLVDPAQLPAALRALPAGRPAGVGPWRAGTR